MFSLSYLVEGKETFDPIRTSDPAVALDRLEALSLLHRTCRMYYNGGLLKNVVNHAIAP